MIGLAVVGAIGATVVTIGTGGAAAPIIGGVAGGVVGYGAGKGNEKLVRKRINDTKFDSGRQPVGNKEEEYIPEVEQQDFKGLTF